MYMSSQISGWHTTHDKLLRMTWKDPEFNTMVLVTSQRNISLSNKSASKPSGVVSSSISDANAQESTCTLETQDETVQEAESFEGQSNDSSTTSMGTLDRYFKPRPRNLAEEEEGNMCTSSPDQTAEEKSMQTLRWQLAIEAIRSYPVLQERFSPLDSHHLSHNQYLKPSVEELVTRYSSNWPSPTLLKRSQTEGKKMGMALWCASMAYGAVHIAAWNYYFPSRTEAIMWKFSAICITASGFIWLVINSLRINLSTGTGTGVDL
jgi:hypothetical protein